MCGISGIVDFRRPVDPAAIARMNHIQRHRGPDGSAIWQGDGVAFGFVRLAIVDVPHGTQPTSNEDGTIHVVFNGEIYNHKELRAALAARGHSFRSECDVEVIPHLYEEYGTAFVERLDGDFAIAIWDARERQLVLARDRVGVKPLFFHTGGGAVVFASEMKGIFASGFVSPSMDPQGLSDCLFYGHTIAPGTFWAGVRELEPATVLTIGTSGETKRRYFRPFVRAEQDKPLLSGKAAIEEFRHVFAESVRKRLPDEVGAGVALSGGIDSAAIAAVAARRHNTPLHTISVKLLGAIHDETAMSSLVADSLGMTNDEVEMSGARACDLLPTSMWSFETPFWYGAVATPLLALTQRAREHGLKVMMSGDGSDELLAGYDFYRLMRLDSKLDKLRLGRLKPRVWQQATKWVGAPSGLDAQITTVASRFDEYTARFGEVPPWIYLWSALGDTTRDLVPGLPMPSALPDPPEHDKLRRQLHFEFYTRLPHWVLPISDRLGMASSVEFRVPFLDRDVIDHAAELSPNMLVHLGTEKYVLRQSVADILPRPTVRQRKKPFMTPITDWYLSGPGADLAGDHLSAAAAKRFGVFDPAATERLWRTALAQRGTWRGVTAEWACMAILTTHLVLGRFGSEDFGATVAAASGGAGS